MTALAQPEIGPILSVAIQGAEGSYSDQAARYLYGPDYHMMGFDTFDGLFDAVLEGAIGVCPIENSIRGEVPEANKLLARHAGRLSIVGELYLGIHLSLIGLEDADPGRLAAVHSHPVALAQCAKSRSKLPGEPKAIVEADTAGSLDVIKDLGDPTHAAVASKLALATRNGLRELRDSFEDDPTNTTRFLVLQKGISHLPADATKTTLLLTHPQSHQALVSSAQIITELQGNTGGKTSIVASRLHPVSQEGRPFDPAYLLDVNLGHQDARLGAVLNTTRISGAHIMLLGSYAAGPTI